MRKEIDEVKVATETLSYPKGQGGLGKSSVCSSGIQVFVIPTVCTGGFVWPNQVFQGLSHSTGGK